MKKQEETERLFAQLYRPLCLYALHYLGDVPRAEDQVQEAFVSLWQEPQMPANPRAWLYAVVRNRCISVLRQARSQRRDDIVPLEEIAPRDAERLISDEEAIRDSEQEARLWEAVRRLPERRREILLMAKRDGMSYRAIAAELGLSEQTVRNQISRALAALREGSDRHLSMVLLFFV